MTFRSHNYCIVGAGPAGLTLAYHLVQAGQRVRHVLRNTIVKRRINRAVRQRVEAEP